MNGIFLSLRDNDSFHTLIIKKSVGEYTFFCSLGYSGGGTFDEFYGKFKYNNQNVITGFYSNSLGSGEWEEKITSVKFDSIDQRFKVQKEDLFELMDTNDNKIQNQILEEISEFVYWGYDEETDHEYDDPGEMNIDVLSITDFDNKLHQGYSSGEYDSGMFSQPEDREDYEDYIINCLNNPESDEKFPLILD